MKKNSFTLLELILVVLLISILYSMFKLNKNPNTKLDEVSKKLELQIKYLRYKALIDSKKNHNENKWHKKRWTLKFFNCKKSLGGIYYVMYSDNNMLGHPNKTESLKDPLTNKYIYNSNSCSQKDDLSKYTLLTKNFDIINIDIDCNETTSIGQLSFGNDGNVYTKLSNDENSYKLMNDCKIKLRNKHNKIKEIEIKKETGMIKLY